MNTKQRITLLSTAGLIAGIAIAWMAMGFQVFTKSEIPVRQTDELLGISTIVWQKTFLLGLDIAGPVALALLMLAGLLTFLFRTRPSTITK